MQVQVQQEQAATTQNQPVQREENGLFLIIYILYLTNYLRRGQLLPSVGELCEDHLPHNRMHHYPYIMAPFVRKLAEKRPLGRRLGLNP